MNKIETQIKDAFNQFRKDGNLHAFLRKLLYDADYSVRFAWQFSETLDALKRQCPPPIFECVFYDGENGEYHLLDFDPNLPMSKKSFRAKVENCLQNQCHIDPDDVDKAMESVYLIDTNMMRKVV